MKKKIQLNFEEFVNGYDNSIKIFIIGNNILFQKCENFFIPIVSFFLCFFLLLNPFFVAVVFFFFFLSRGTHDLNLKEFQFLQRLCQVFRSSTTSIIKHQPLKMYNVTSVVYIGLFLLLFASNKDDAKNYRSFLFKYLGLALAFWLHSINSKKLWTLNVYRTV